MLTPSDDNSSRVRGHLIANLRYHWGDWFNIWWEGGLFYASRIDNHMETLADPSSEMLHKLMLANYINRMPLSAHLS